MILLCKFSLIISRSKGNLYGNFTVYYAGIFTNGASLFLIKLFHVAVKMSFPSSKAKEKWDPFEVFKWKYFIIHF